ncbi:MAG: MAPEG family protein [Alphaproteobacteria bacterium]
MLSTIQFTVLCAAILGLLYAFLSIRVVVHRVRYKVSFQDGGNPKLALAIRVHANFFEYVPICLVLMYLAVSIGAAAWIIYAAGGSLIAGRLLHAAWYGRHPGTSFGRFVGTNLTWLALIGLSGACLLYALKVPT